MEEPNASRGLQMPPVVGTLPAHGHAFFWQQEGL